MTKDGVDQVNRHLCHESASERATPVRRTTPAAFSGAAWPAVLRVEVAAAYLGFETTAEMMRAIHRGSAPRPNDRRGRKPIWYRADIDRWIEARIEPGFDGDMPSLADEI